MKKKLYGTLLIVLACLLVHAQHALSREQIPINDGWRSMRYTDDPGTLIYDTRHQPPFGSNSPFVQSSFNNSIKYPFNTSS